MLPLVCYFFASIESRHVTFPSIQVECYLYYVVFNISADLSVVQAKGGRM